MENLDFWYLVVLFALFMLVNFAYKHFPKTEDKLYEILTEDHK